MAKRKFWDYGRPIEVDSTKATICEVRRVCRDVSLGQLGDLDLREAWIDGNRIAVTAEMFRRAVLRGELKIGVIEDHEPGMHTIVCQQKVL